MEITVSITGNVQRFRANLAGVSHVNTDGTSRQKVLKDLRTGDKLILRRENSNPHDPYAVAVFRSDGTQVGYIPAGDVRLANHIDSGGSATAQVVQITGGPGILGLIFSRFRKTYGCIVEVVKEDPDWKLVSPYMERSSEIEALISESQTFEKEDASRSIDGYRRAIAGITELDNISLVAASWRRARYPINRLSLVLEKQGQFSEALQAILTYEGYTDIYGISAADKKSIAARKERLIKRLSDNR